MSKTRMPHRSKSGLPGVMAAFILAAGCSPPRATLIYDALVDGRGVKVVSVPSGTRLSDLDSLVAGELASSGMTGLVYADYRKHRSIEPLAVYSNGALLYYSPLYAATPPPKSARSEVIAPAYVTGGRIGAVCGDGWRSSATGRGACSKHGGVSAWRYEQILDSNALLATICGDYLLQAGLGDCAAHQGPWLKIRQADPRSFSPARVEGGERRRAGFKKLELDATSAELQRLLNEWIDSDLPIEPFRVLMVPGLERLPSSMESLFMLLPPQHGSLMGDFAQETERFETAQGLDLLGRHEEEAGWPAAAQSYFADRDLDIVEGNGIFGDPYWIFFDWVVALDRENQLLFSFILNQRDYEED